MSSLKCPECKSTMLVKHGKVQCGQKKRQRYLCTKCWRDTCYPLGMSKPKRKAKFDRK